MKQRLREILYTVPEIKKDLEELKFGCDIEIGDKPYIVTYYNNERPIETMRIVDGDYGREVDYDIIMGDFKIIGSPLEERHLRMYCKKNKISTNFNEDGVIEFSSLGFVKIQLDNTKSFNDQTDEVEEKMLEYLLDKDLLGKTID